MVCTDNSALLSNSSAAALQEGTEQRILLMGRALIFLMAAGSDSPFLSHSFWHCHTYLTALNPPLSLCQRIRNLSTVICLGQNNLLWGAIFHSSSSYCCLTGNHLMLFRSKMSPVCRTAVPTSLPSSHTLLFYLTLKWQLSRHYRIIYLFIYLFIYFCTAKYKYIYIYICSTWASDLGIARSSFRAEPHGLN